ncbi:hypothetical protein [Gordonia aichiensis]|uniref:hypothetical protein n=1 Tax=Gordonia aichiensis TaxID=36820 RepID=UPI0032642281
MSENNVRLAGALLTEVVEIQRLHGLAAERLHQAVQDTVTGDALTAYSDDMRTVKAREDRIRDRYFPAATSVMVDTLADTPGLTVWFVDRDPVHLEADAHLVEALAETRVLLAAEDAAEAALFGPPPAELCGLSPLLEGNERWWSIYAGLAVEAFIVEQRDGSLTVAVSPDLEALDSCTTAHAARAAAREFAEASDAVDHWTARLGLEGRP